ncbi:MAG TPA: type IV pilus assembly protein PilM [Phycisphaerae bacterium]|nr:type IV pilus assembly protein PilM [Phycisphaerae bacterium]
MASKLPVWGIDVGQCSLKAIKLQQAGDQVEMLAFDIVEHETILSQAGSNAAELAKKAIETFLSRQNIRDSQVVVSVPGQQTLTRFTKMPPVEPKKIPDMVQYEASQQIPFDMDEVVWDYQVFTEKDSPDVEVGIFAIRKELIRNYLTQFTDGGISPFIVQSSPMASYNAARFEQPTEPGKATILLDMGALATDLIVMEGNRIWSRPVPIGGNRFTEALVSAFKISFGKAERLKKTAAASKHARQIFQAMRPVLQDLVSEIQRSIGYYTSTHRDAHIARALGMGNAFKLPGLQKFLQQNLQIEVEKLGTFKKMVAAERAPEFVENTMSFGVAYGLAVQGLGLAAVESNLLPQEVRRTLLWRQKKAWFAGATAALALAAGVLWVGNATAKGQMDKALGGLTKVESASVGSVQEAQRIIEGGSSGPPLERAAKVAGAAERLKQEFSKVSSTPIGDKASFDAMAALLGNNSNVPKILDCIHRAFEQASPESLKTVNNVQDYIKAVGGMSRSERQELWIQSLDMRYDLTNVMELLPGGSKGGEPDEKGRGGAGWLITLVGETNRQEETPTWLEDNLIKKLDKLGKEPNRGFYFEMIKLAKVLPKGSGGGDLGPPDVSPRGGDRAPSRSQGGQPQAGPRVRGRAGPSEPRGQVPTPRGATENPRAASPAGAEAPASGDPMEQWKAQARDNDPVFPTEKTDKDQQFQILIVARNTNTPKNLIPEEFRQPGDKPEAKAEAKPEAKPEAKQPQEGAPPPEEPRRD